MNRFTSPLFQSSPFVHLQSLLGKKLLMQKG
jgi:hypothetical protein